MWFKVFLIGAAAQPGGSKGLCRLEKMGNLQRSPISFQRLKLRLQAPPDDIHQVTAITQRNRQHPCEILQ